MIEEELLGDVIEEYSADDGVVNPFMKNDYIRAYRVYEKVSVTATDGYMSKDEVMVHNGSSRMGGVISNSYLADLDQSTRLFHGNIKFEDSVLNLRPGSMKLFFLLLFKLRKNSDRIRIFAGKYGERTGHSSRTTFYGAIQDLIDAGLITRYKMNVYWVNPKVFFNGNRIEKYPDNVVEVNE